MSDVVRVGPRVEPAGPYRAHRFDYLPAEGSWPGGYRYGFRQRAIVEDRPWTVQQRFAARLLGLELPAQDIHYYDTWWDMPTPEKLVAVPLPLTARWVREDEDPILDLAMPQIDRTPAKKWGRHFWHLPDPVDVARYFGRM